MRLSSAASPTSAKAAAAAPAPHAWRLLTGHFFGAMFHLGILSDAGADSFKHMLLGGVGIFVTTAFVLVRIFAKKYALLSAEPTALPYRTALLGDDFLIIALPMLMAALVTLGVSDSLFPDRRDFRVLGPLPVTRSLVFRCKLAALLMFNALFIVTAHLSLVPLMLLTSFSVWREIDVMTRLLVWGAASGAASAFAALIVTGLLGLLNLVFSASRLQSSVALLRSVMLGVLVWFALLLTHTPTLGAHFAAQHAWVLVLPPAWFVGLARTLAGSAEPWLGRLGVTALLALSAASVLVAVIYLRLYLRYERLMSGASHALLPADARRVAGPTPGFRAVRQFIRTTLRRSQLHRSALVGLTACGGAIVADAILRAHPERWPGSPDAVAALADTARWTPFAIMFACGLAVRASFALPIEHEANWIFRLTEHQALRREQLRAVDWFTMTYVVLAPCIAGAPLLWLTLGKNALAAELVVALVGVVFSQALLHDWRRIPFTCSYLPAKRLFLVTAILSIGTYGLLTTVGSLLAGWAVLNGWAALIIAIVLAVAARQLRRHRETARTAIPLAFEDAFPDQVQPLHLQG